MAGFFGRVTIVGMPYDLLWLTIPAYFIVQFVALARTSGRARIAAGLPLAVMVPALAVTVIGFVRGSNLWPLLLLLASPLALAYVAVAAFAVRRPSNSIAP